MSRDNHSSQPFKQDAPQRGPSPGSKELTVRQLLVEYKTLITVSGLLLVAAVVFTDMQIEIPQEVKLYGLVAVGSAVLAYPFGTWVVNRLYSRPEETVVDLDARDSDYAEYSLSPEQFGELRVVGADTLADRRCQTGRIWFGRSMRYLDEGDRDHDHPMDGAEQNDGKPVFAPATGWYINGTWKASADDLELEQEREKIDEIRKKLELEAMSGLAERIKMPGATRTAVRQITRVVLNGLESGTIHHGDDLQEIVDSVMSSYQMERLTGMSEEEAEEARDAPQKQPGNIGDMNIEQLKKSLTDDVADSQEVPADD